MILYALKSLDKYIGKTKTNIQSYFQELRPPYKN
jgi:hypothetical protein